MKIKWLFFILGVLGLLSLFGEPLTAATACLSLFFMLLVSIPLWGKRNLRQLYGPKA